MKLLGRSREIRTLRERTGGPGPGITVVTGRAGAGKTRLLHAVLDSGVEAEVLWHGAPPLPDVDQRALLARGVANLLRDRPAEPPVEAPGEGASWPEIFEALDAWLYRTRRPAVLVLDGWGHMVEAWSRLPGEVAGFWAGVRRRGLPLHLVLASRPGAATDALLHDGPLAEWVEEEIRLGSLPFRDVVGHLSPDAPARERLRVRSVFGGWPDVVARVPPGRSLERMVREAVLEPEAPLLRWGSELLEREVQSPARYAALLRAVARGGEEWGGLRRAVPDFSSGGQMAPYIQRLGTLGLVSVERSLDARAGSRSRRYRATDPFVAFWFRFVLPHLGRLERDREPEIWRERIRPALDGHAALHFPALCREYLARHADERLGAVARETGGLWGSGYDLPASGTLRTGAVVYGKTWWSPKAPDASVVDAIEEELGETRYGFGREARLRVAFTATPPDEELLRRAARDDGVVVIGARDLAGP